MKGEGGGELQRDCLKWGMKAKSASGSDAGEEGSRLPDSYRKKGTE